MKVNEIFTSIQGEGSYVGMPCIFLRLQGCDYNCSLCDTKDSISTHAGKEISIDDIVQELLQHNLDTVVITGGNPLFADDIVDLICAISEAGLKIHIETQGTFLYKIVKDSIYEMLEHISISPKMQERKVWDASFTDTLSYNINEMIYYSDYLTIDIKYPCIPKDIQVYKIFINKLKIRDSERIRKYIMVRSNEGEDYQTACQKLIKTALKSDITGFFLQPQVHKLIGDIK